MVSPHFYNLILVTNRIEEPLSDYLLFIRRCASAGITAVQLREKNASADFLIEFGARLKEILDPLQIPLIINDHIDLAVKLDAAGVHLGQTDGIPDLARKKLGPNKIIGLSIEHLANLEKANHYSLNYVAASAVFPSKNKSNLKTTWGLEGVSRIRKETQHPLVAIGGINLINVASVLKSGAQGIAVIGAVHDASNPVSTICKLRRIIDSKEENHV